MLGRDRGQRRQGLGEEGVRRGATQTTLSLARMLCRPGGSGQRQPSAAHQSPGRSRVAPKGQEGLQPRRCPGLPLPPASGAAPVLTVVCGHVWSQNHKEGR